jgi:hypothetical protein
MLRLVWKDAAAARWILLIVIPVGAIQLATLTVSPPAHLLGTLALSGLLAFGSIALEEIQGTEVLWCSLPLSRREYVLGRYLTTFTGATLGLSIGFATAYATALWAFRGGEETAVRPSPVLYAILLALLLFAAAGHFPCMFRFGVGRGMMVFSAAAAILLLVLSGLAYLLAPMSGRTPSAEEIELATAWLSRWRYVLAGAFLAAAALATLVSAAFSIRLFEARDL